MNNKIEMNYTIDKWFPKSIYHVDNMHTNELSKYIREIILPQLAGAFT